MEKTRRELATIPPAGPDRRRDPKMRKQMSGPAIRAFFQIADAWSLSNRDQIALLGWLSDATFFKYKSGSVGALSYDVLIRISLLLGIYKDLHILYPDDGLADRWIHLPNLNPLFGGEPALRLMIDDGIDGLYHVRRLLDARRGGWN